MQTNDLTARVAGQRHRCSGDGKGQGGVHCQKKGQRLGAVGFDRHQESADRWAKPHQVHERLNYSEGSQNKVK